MGMLEDHLTEVARMRERDQKIADLQTELDKAHRLVGQSIQWQRDAEIKQLNLRAATIEECAQVVVRYAEWSFDHGDQHGHNVMETCAERIRALKESNHERIESPA